MNFIRYSAVFFLSVWKKMSCGLCQFIVYCRWTELLIHQLRNGVQKRIASPNTFGSRCRRRDAAETIDRFQSIYRRLKKLADRFWITWGYSWSVLVFWRCARGLIVLSVAIVALFWLEIVVLGSDFVFLCRIIYSAGGFDVKYESEIVECDFCSFHRIRGRRVKELGVELLFDSEFVLKIQILWLIGHYFI